MHEFSNPEALLRILLLALPVAVLVTLIMLVVKKKSKKPQRPLTVFDTGESDAPRQQAGASPVANPDRNKDAMLQNLTFPELVSDTQDGLALVKQRLDAALGAGDKVALAPLYLELARAHRDAGQHSDCLTALRSAAGLASQHGPRTAHADARLELAEAAFVSGDLTSACEHWQLAKIALHDDGQREAQVRVEKRMRDNGCPTDWVLTDF